MGTRGAYGFYKDGVTKVTYNHYDSYPSCLGNNIKEFMSINDYEVILDVFNRIEMVEEGQTPTVGQIEKLKQYYNGSVNAGSLKDFYALLRDTQGNLNAYVDDKNLSYMIDNQDFLEDELFCEWAYIINLDEEAVEIYASGKKVATVPFSEIESFDMDGLEESLNNY